MEKLISNLCNVLSPRMVVYPINKICCTGYTLEEYAYLTEKVLQWLSNFNIEMNAEPEVNFLR